MFVYVGTYTEDPLGHAEGIEVFTFDPASGELTLAQTVRGIANPSFLALDSQQRYFYAVNELDEGGASAFARNPDTGKLTFVNRQSSHGAAPCYISLDHSGRFALVANYIGGTIAALPIAPDGNLKSATSVVYHEGSSVLAHRQEHPHPHMIAPTPDGRFVLATDLGTDEVLVYRLDASGGRLIQNDVGAKSIKGYPGAGPRHFCFSSDGRWLYLINELDSTLSVYDYDAERGEFALLQRVTTLPAGFEGPNTCAHVAVSADGRFVYGPNRGHDSIAIWSVNSETAEISSIGYESTRGKDPRHFAIDPSGAWLLAANQRSHTIVTFRRQQDTGLLKLAGHVTHVSSPASIVFAGD